MASQLKTAYAFTLADSGHSVLTSSPSDCSGPLVLQFLADPTAEPDGSIKGPQTGLLGRVTPLNELTLKEATVAEGVTARIPEQWTQAKALVFDANDPINAPTGILNFTLVQANSAQAAIDAQLKDAKVIAADQQIGSNKWTIAEGETTAAGRQIEVRMAATLLADGKTVLLVRLMAPVNTAPAVFEALWEPVLSSVNVAAK